MRKLVLLLAVIALAAMPSVADAAKKKEKKAAAKPAPAAQTAGIPEQPIVKFFQAGTKSFTQPAAPAGGAKGKKKT